MGTSPKPMIISNAVPFKETRHDHRDFSPEAIFAIITIPGAFLTVRSHPVANNFMGNPTITNEFYREGTVFKNRFMAPLDNPGHKSRGAGVGDLGFRLIANPPTLFKALQDCGSVNRGNEFHIRLNNLHFC